MKYLGLYCICLAVLLACCDAKHRPSSNQKTAPFITQLSKEMHGLSSNFRITTSELKKWDEIVRNLSLRTPLAEGGEYRLFAYLYCAQKAFADRSFALTSEYSGNLDDVSFQVVRLFYPDYQNQNLERDAFSQKLTQVVMSDVTKRFFDEQKQIHTIQISKGEDQWRGEDPVGLQYPTMKPRAMHSVDEFQSTPPPSPNSLAWDDQLDATKENLNQATETQKQRSRFWQRLIDPEAADWRYIAVQYMNQKSVSLEMQLEVRAKMMMALMDALIAVFHDKYTYMVKRPFMRDPEMKPLFTTPNHPSYPAAHGTLAAAAETILMYYFPEDGKRWKDLAAESGESRLWGGIHFPIDIKAGHMQGQQVGKAVLFRSQVEL